MKRKLLAIAVPLALGFGSSANAGLTDTYLGLEHSEAETAFVSGTSLTTPYSFDFTLSMDSALSFVGETSFDFASIGLYSGSSLLSGFILTPMSSELPVSFELAAGDYSFKSLMPLSGPGYYTFTTTVSPVPEPETYGMFLAGIGMLGLIARRKLNAKA